LLKCEIVTPSIVEVYEALKEFYKTSKMSESVYAATAYYHPHFPLMFSELIQLNIHTHIIISQELLDKLNAQHDPAFERLLGSDYFHLYVYPKNMGFMSFGYNDYCLRMSLLTSSGEYDNKYVLSYNPSSLEWAKDFFDYCLKDSTSVSEI